MNFRKIEFNKDVMDKELEIILTQLAKWHNLTPKLWLPDYKMSTKDIEQTKQKIKDTASENLFLAIAEDNEGQVQGFIWANKQNEPQDSVMILSLYVTDKYRKCGVATKLKDSLEEWCLLEGVKTIQTTVHYTNHNMLELNKKLGYKPGMVYMTKTLSS